MSPRDAAVLALARQRGVLRSRDLETQGLGRTYLRRLCERGLLIAVGRGLYVRSDASLPAYQTLLEVARRVPDGVICLLSALRFHEIGTQSPAAVWLAIETGKRVPHLAYPPLEVVRQSGPAWTTGVASHDLRVGTVTVPVRITTPAKTVADCFKFRHRVGLDVALEALRATLRDKKATVDELWAGGEADRVARVMRPYLEAMLAS